jgi:hypothetical protein
MNDVRLDQSRPDFFVVYSPQFFGLIQKWAGAIKGRGHQRQGQPMSNVRELNETGIPYTLTTELDQPLILERDGEAVAVLLSMAEYQALTARQEYLTAGEARRAADKAVFRDLVGCALSSGAPIWSPQPHPHWRVPYHFINGPLLKIVSVDARTGEVSLSEPEREALLQEVGNLAEENATSSAT